jgi:putative spermidine/putrescine transport system substrate-binding protein
MSHLDDVGASDSERTEDSAVPNILTEQITRVGLLKRAAVAGIAAAGFGSLFAARAGSAAAGAFEALKGSLTFTSWGGTTQAAQQKAWTTPFGKKHHITVNQGGPTDYGRIKAMVQAKQIEWDVIDVEGDFAIRAGNQGLLAPIDYSVVPKKDIFPQFVQKYGVADLVASVVIAYNPHKHPNAPKNWADFFNLTKFPGKRSMYKPLGSQQGVIEAALLADGVHPNHLYPLDFNRALNKLDTIKSSIVWWETGAQSQEFLVDGTVDYIAAWNGRMYDAKKQGASIAIQWNQNLLVADYLVSPKGDPRHHAAMQLIAYSVSPHPQAKFAELTAYAPVNKRAVKLVHPSVRPYMSTTRKNRKKGIVVNIHWWAKNAAKYQSQWDAWLLS